MAFNNPISGGPDLISALRNALEKTPNVYAKPPLTGGTQISSRFADDRLAILDAICEQSGWNRNQVINALVDRGLLVLFQQISDVAVDAIMDHAADKIMPTFDPYAGMAKELASFNRFQIFPAIQLIRIGQLPEQSDKTWLISKVETDRGTIELQDVAAGWLLPLHVSHIEKFYRDTVSDAKDGLKHCMLELNVQVVINENQLTIVPISAGRFTDKPAKARETMKISDEAVAAFRNMPGTRKR